jgi:hypothetical protein
MTSTTPSFTMTHIANLGDLQSKNPEVIEQINQALEESLVNKEQYDKMVKNLVPKETINETDTITELLLLSIGQSDRSQIQLSVSKEYYCSASYNDIFGEKIDIEVV